MAKSQKDLTVFDDYVINFRQLVLCLNFIREILMSKKKSKAKQREINAHKKAWKKRTRQVKKKVLNGIILGKDQEEAE
jgi:hypothetical protein